MMFDPIFVSIVMRPINIENLYDLEVQNLSGGELQKLAIVITLGKSEDVYLIDEPSAYLDSEQRIVISKIIKKFIYHFNKTAFIIEHDLMMAISLSDKVIVFSGTPSITGLASSPQPMIQGFNSFLKSLNVTFRNDSVSNRPRINKYGSNLDQLQKSTETFFSV